MSNSKRIERKRATVPFIYIFLLSGTHPCIVETLNITKTKQSSLLPVCWMLVFAEKEEKGGKVSVVVCLMNK